MKGKETYILPAFPSVTDRAYPSVCLGDPLSYIARIRKMHELNSFMMSDTQLV